MDQGRQQFGNRHPAMWVGWILVLSSGALGWWMLAPVMRESDQASVLSGALALSRDFQPFECEFYNYDKTWISYWILSAVFRVAGPVSLGELVQIGNGTAWLIGWVGIGAAVVFASRRGWGPLLMCGSILLTPVWLLSLPLLSSNVISAGFLGLWVVSMEWERMRKCKWIGLVVAGMMTFLAVGSRADAVLVLPALCLAWWGIGRSWAGMLKERMLWASFVGALGALLVGHWMALEPGATYAAFFKWQTFTGFFVFGMGGVLFWYVGLLCFLIWCRRERVWRLGEWAWLLALLLPLIFYGRVLYSPRHLMTGVLVICLSGVFSASRDWFDVFRRSRAGWLFVFGIFTLVVPLFVGVGLSSLTSGRVVVGDGATRYPTADGHWPMGGYLNFCADVRMAVERPIDHNQRIWGAWEQVDSAVLPEGSVCVFSYALWSYGRFWCEWNGRECVEPDDFMPGRDLLVGDDRTQIRGDVRPSVAGEPRKVRNILREAMQKFDGVKIVGAHQDGKILHFTNEGTEEGRKLLEAIAEIRQRSGGNGYVVGQFGPEKGVANFPKVRRWIVVTEGNGEFLVRVEEVFPEGLLDTPEKEGWYAWSELPLFFDVNRY